MKILIILVGIISILLLAYLFKEMFMGEDTI